VAALAINNELFFSSANESSDPEACVQVMPKSHALDKLLARLQR